MCAPPYLRHHEFQRPALIRRQLHPRRQSGAGAHMTKHLVSHQRLQELIDEAGLEGKYDLMEALCELQIRRAGDTNGQH